MPSTYIFSFWPPWPEMWCCSGSFRLVVLCLFRRPLNSSRSHRVIRMRSFSALFTSWSRLLFFKDVLASTTRVMPRALLCKQGETLWHHTAMMKSQIRYQHSGSHKITNPVCMETHSCFTTSDLCGLQWVLLALCNIISCLFLSP